MRKNIQIPTKPKKKLVVTIFTWRHEVGRLTTYMYNSLTSLALLKLQAHQYKWSNLSSYNFVTLSSDRVIQQQRCVHDWKLARNIPNWCPTNVEHCVCHLLCIRISFVSWEAAVLMVCVHSSTVNRYISFTVMNKPPEFPLKKHKIYVIVVKTMYTFSTRCSSWIDGSLGALYKLALLSSNTEKKKHKLWKQTSINQTKGTTTNHVVHWTLSKNCS